MTRSDEIHQILSAERPGPFLSSLIEGSSGHDGPASPVVPDVGPASARPGPTRRPEPVSISVDIDWEELREKSRELAEKYPELIEEVRHRMWEAHHEFLTRELPNR